MPLPSTIWPTPVHVDSIDTGIARAGFRWILGANDVVPDLAAVASITMSLARPDNVELDGLPVTIAERTSARLEALYAFRLEDLAATRPGRVGKYRAYLRGITTDGRDFRTPVAVLLVVGRFTP